MAIHTWYDDTEDIATRRKTLTSKETDKHRTISTITNLGVTVCEKECVCVCGGGGGGRRMNLHSLSVCVHNEHQGQKPYHAANTTTTKYGVISDKTQT